MWWSVTLLQEFRRTTNIRQVKFFSPKAVVVGYFTPRVSKNDKHLLPNGVSFPFSFFPRVDIPLCCSILFLNFETIMYVSRHFGFLLWMMDTTVVAASINSKMPAGFSEVVRCGHKQSV